MITRTHQTLFDPETAHLIYKAREASLRAQCRYSNFAVGAVVKMASGCVYDGCNVENASYGLTCCAERSAVFSALSHGNEQPRILRVIIYTPTPRPSASCGACRQVLNEFGPEADFLCVCDSSEILQGKIEDLLPEAFGPHNL